MGIKPIFLDLLLSNKKYVFCFVSRIVRDSHLDSVMLNSAKNVNIYSKPVGGDTGTTFANGIWGNCFKMPTFLMPTVDIYTWGEFK